MADKHRAVSRKWILDHMLMIKNVSVRGTPADVCASQDIGRKPYSRSVMSNARLMDATPVTELTNVTTIGIDLSDSTGIVRLLRQCDAQIFSGWETYPCLYDKEILQSLEQLSKSIQQVLEDPCHGCVVFSGCGTSGRIGFLLSKKFNSLAKEQGIGSSGPYEYLIAGGDLALFASVEMPEDDWRQGQIDLMKLAKEKNRVVHVGITCGLSAPYVAGQLDYCIDNPDIFTPVLIGFNPIEFARKTLIEGWSKTFHDVAKRLSSHEKAIILNPVVGPEAISGSSRMKGGSATKILLETALTKAHYQFCSSGPTLSTITILYQYERVYRQTYLLIEEISSAMSLEGESLGQKGHVYYLVWGSASFIALLDASECVPTFSASFDDVRAFVEGGFEFLKNREGALTFKGSKLQLSLQEFATSFLPKVSMTDTVVAVCLNPKWFGQAYEIIKQVSEKKAKLVGISAQNEESSTAKDFKKLLDVSIEIKERNEKYNTDTCVADSPEIEKLFKECLDELAVKWILNAISTGAHVLNGKVLRSCMIDLKVSNNKLFHRAVGIISKFTGVTSEDAKHALLRAIYRKDVLPESALQDATSCHVFLGERQDHVVPLALLIATGKFNVEEGLKTLREKTISRALDDLGLLGAKPQQ